MADLTLKDVLKAIAEMRGEMDGRFNAVDKRFDQVETQLADLDKELTAHAGTHREIEKDIEALKQRAPRTAARAPRRPRTR